MQSQILGELNIYNSIYDFVDEYEPIHYPFHKIGKYKYVELHMSFDIETTTIGDKESGMFSTMYIWQFGLNNNVIFGRTWNELKQLFDFISLKILTPKTRAIVWVANLSYEFQFIHKHFHITNLFAKEKRQPLKFDIDNLEFRDALALTGGSLKKLAQDYCSTQKAVGDLDYSIIRNRKTVLTPDELGYCINDVVILVEFSHYIFNTILPKYNKIPLTKTGYVREDISQHVDAWCKQKGISRNALYRFCRTLYPKTKEEYIFHMEYLFRGGYVHGNIAYSGATIDEPNMRAVDFTSSYPSVILKDYVPITPFIETPFNPELLKSKCCIMLVEFENISSKTTHAIESKSKLIKHLNGVFDNGRLVSSDSIIVCINEQDYQSYNEFYDWEKMNVLNFKIAERGFFPEYYTKPLSEYYIKKDVLKKAHKPYAHEKSMVNSFYGETVTRLNFQEIAYSNDGSWGVGDGKSYEQQISRKTSSCYWGVWVCSSARRNELKTLFKMNDAVMYSDTDSHKLVNNKYDDYISEYNRINEQRNIAMCERLNLPLEYFHDIGNFDNEPNPIKFKTLGAKRYIYTTADGELHQTISGLGKSALNDYCKSNNVNPYEYFDDGMFIPSEYTGKLTSYYYDTPVEMDVDGVTHSELSYISLAPCEFTLKLKPEYTKMIDVYTNRLTRLAL